jgi:hypothetical protein
VRGHDLIPALLMLGVGCKPPPEAPQALDELCGYLYAHMPDEEPDALKVGVENLYAWLGDHLEETYEGYAVTDLDQDTVDALDDLERDLDGLAGAAVGSPVAYSVDEIAEVLTIIPQSVVFPETYDVYERTWLSEPGCFPGRDCDTVSATNYSEASYPLGLKVASENTAQFRWVETDLGWVMVHRTWLNGPADVSLSWLGVAQQYYMTITMPHEGGALRLQATWIVAEMGSGNVPEATALNQVIGSMQEIDVDVEAFLDGR